MTAGAVIAGYGSGTRCHLCGEAIGRNQVVYEVRDTRTDRWLSFHIRCHAMWRLECEDRSQPGSAAAASHV